MKNKFNFLVDFNLKRKIKSKSFIISNIVILILTLFMTNINSIFKLFAPNKSIVKIGIIDNANSYELVNKYIELTNKDNASYKIEMFKYQGNKDTIKQDILDKKLDILTIVNESIEDYINVEIITDKKIRSDYEKLLNIVFTQARSEIIVSKTNIDPNVLVSISKPLNIVANNFNNDNDDTRAIGMLGNVIMIPLFMLLTLSMQFVGADVNDEKTSRGMEIIMSSVKPKDHLLSKVLSVNIFVVLQSILLLLYGAIGLFINGLINNLSMNKMFLDVTAKIGEMNLSNGLSNNLIMFIIIYLLLVVITIFLCSLLAGVLASMSTNAEDFQQLMTPATMILLLGYYFALFAGYLKGNLLLRISAYVPIISSMVLPTLMVTGDIGIIDVWLSLFVSLIACLITVKYGLRVYKAGVLNYSSTNLWKKVYKALKTK